METFESVLHFLLKENHSSSQSKLNLDAAVQVYKEMLNGGLEPGTFVRTVILLILSSSSFSSSFHPMKTLILLFLKQTQILNFYFSNKHKYSTFISQTNSNIYLFVFYPMLGVKLLTTFIKAYHSKNQWGTVKNLFSLLDFEGGSKSIKGDLKVATAYANAMIDSLNESEFKKIVELVACSSFFLDIKWLTTLVRGFTKFQMPDECCKIETQLKTRHGLRINDLHIILHAQCKISFDIHP